MSKNGGVFELFVGLGEMNRVGITGAAAGRDPRLCARARRDRSCAAQPLRRQDHGLSEVRRSRDGQAGVPSHRTAGAPISSGRALALATGLSRVYPLRGATSAARLVRLCGTRARTPAGGVKTLAGGVKAKTGLGRDCGAARTEAEFVRRRDTEYARTGKAVIRRWMKPGPGLSAAGVAAVSQWFGNE